MNTSPYTNIAFISYKREDEEWAKWLQKKLEHYKLPTEIRKQNPDLEFAKNPRHVFKDTTDLSGGVLAKAIKEGLDSSKFLIVICSPRAAKSEWVCKEVQDFIDSGREEYIIPFIIDGEPYAKDTENECFPEALKALAGERELLGININENGREAAAVKVVARLFNLRFDTLWDRFQREEKKQRRRIIGTFIAAILFLLCVIAGGAYAYYEIQKERDRAELETKRANEAKERAIHLNKQLAYANDSISKQKSELQDAYDNLSRTERELASSNIDLAMRNAQLEVEKRNVLTAKNEKYLQEMVSNFLECQKMLADSQYVMAFESVRDVLLKNGDILPESLHDNFEFILRTSFQAINNDNPILVKRIKAESGFDGLDGYNHPVLFSESDNVIYIGGGDGLSKIDIITGKRLALISEWATDIKIGEKYLVCFDDDDDCATWYDKTTLKKVGGIDFKNLLGAKKLSYISSSKSGERCLIFNEDAQTYVICGVFNKTIIRRCNIDRRRGIGISGNGDILAILKNGQFKLFDVDTGKHIPYLHASFADDIAFDLSGEWLLLYLRQNNFLRAINIYTKEEFSMHIDLQEQEWGNSFNFEADFYKNKYIVSEDGLYVAIAGKIYDMTNEKLLLELADKEQAQSLWISKDAQRVMQVNYDKKIYTYIRKGHKLFRKTNVNFEDLIDAYQLPEGIEVKKDDDIVFYDKGNEIGRVGNLFATVFLVCVSDDKKYALVAAANKKTTLYSIKTGLPIEEYPFVSGDGDMGFGLIENDSTFFFRDLNVIKYRFMPLHELLQIRLDY